MRAVDSTPAACPWTFRTAWCKRGVSGWDERVFTLAHRENSNATEGRTPPMGTQWFHAVSLIPVGRICSFGSSRHSLQLVRRKSWCGAGTADSTSQESHLNRGQSTLDSGKSIFGFAFYLKKKKKKKDCRFNRSCKDSWNKPPACVFDPGLLM